MGIGFHCRLCTNRETYLVKFNLFTVLWGKHHLKLFRDGCFRSLNWTQNKAAIADNIWHIYSFPEHFDELTEIFDKSNITAHIMQIPTHMYVDGCKPQPTETCDGGLIILNLLRMEMKFCLENRSRMLFAPPDTIFGDGSLPAILKAGDQPGSCVFVAHPRVLPEILEDIKYTGATDGSIDNARLVGLANKHAHLSWQQSELGHKENNSFGTGVLWQRVSDKLVQLQHKLPTAYLVDFIIEDWNFWWGCSSFGQYDHTWPEACMVRQQRQRLIGSSDAAFIVEITTHNQNVSKVPRPEGLEHAPADFYLAQKLHNAHNRQTLVYFREE